MNKKSVFEEFLRNIKIGIKLKNIMWVNWLYFMM